MRRPHAEWDKRPEADKLHASRDAAARPVARPGPDAVTLAGVLRAAGVDAVYLRRCHRGESDPLTESSHRRTAFKPARGNVPSYTHLRAIISASLTIPFHPAFSQQGEGPMCARGTIRIGFDGNGPYDGAALEGDRLSWCLAGPLIVATSLGLWAAIGEGICVLIG